jgi:hypothetical protein
MFRRCFWERRVNGWIRRPFTSDGTRRMGEGGDSAVRRRIGMIEMEIGLMRRHLEELWASIC